MNSLTFSVSYGLWNIPAENFSFDETTHCAVESSGSRAWVSSGRPQVNRQVSNSLGSTELIRQLTKPGNRVFSPHGQQENSICICRHSFCILACCNHGDKYVSQVTCLEWLVLCLTTIPSPFYDNLFPCFFYTFTLYDCFPKPVSLRLWKSAILLYMFFVILINSLKNF